MWWRRGGARAASLAWSHPAPFLPAPGGASIARGCGLARAIAPPPRATSRHASASFASSAAPGPDVRAAFAYCSDTVRAHDYESYLCTLFLPRRRRPAALALRAFNVETANALGAAKEPHLALMRLRWWRDAVDALHDDRARVPDHPVARALAAVLRGGRGGAMTRRWMARMVDARVEDAERDGAQPPRLADLERYADDTHASLLCALLDLTGARRDAASPIDADHCAAHVGKAIGIANTLRGASAHAAQRRCYVPADVCAETGAVAEAFHRRDVSDETKDAVHRVASRAKAHLDAARAMRDRIQPKKNGKGKETETETATKPATLSSADEGPAARASAVFLPAVATGAYLDALEARDFDAFHPGLERTAAPIVTQWRIAWAAYRGRY